MQKVHRWQFQYIGTTTLPKTLSTVELSAFFTFSETELAEIARKRKDALRIAAAVQLGYLKRLGIEQLNLDAIPLEKIRAYAEQLRNIRPARFKELKDPLRTLRLVCFLKWTLLQSTDTAIMMGGRLITHIMADAYKHAQALEGKTAMSYHETVVEVFKLVDEPDVSDADFRQLVRDLKASYKPPQFPTRASAARWLLSDPNPQIRSLLNELRKLELKAEKGNETLSLVQYLHDTYAEGHNELPLNHGQKIGRPWRDIIEGEDRERALRAMEAMTLVGLRKTLRSSAVYVDHSEKFRGRHRLMINDADWERDRAVRYAQLSLPRDPHVFLKSLVNELNTKLLLLEESRARGDFHVDGQRFRIPRFKPNVVSKQVEQNKKDLFSKIDIVQFPELILEMDSRTGFSKIILERPAIDSTELLQVYTGMLAHGCALDATDVSHMVPQLTTNQVIAGMRYFEDRDRVRAANDAVVGFQRRLPICEAWGDGSLASADMMSLDVSKQVWRARADYRRKVASVGTYTAVSDFWSVIYDLPIVLNERQAGPAIDSVLHQKEFDV